MIFDDPGKGGSGWAGNFRKTSKKIENFGTDLGWFGDDFGMVWGYFRDGFGPTLKSRKFGSSELKN